jgi:hypothetical protein
LSCFYLFTFILFYLIFFLALFRASLCLTSPALALHCFRGITSGGKSDFDGRPDDLILLISCIRLCEQANRFNGGTNAVFRAGLIILLALASKYIFGAFIRDFMQPYVIALLFN